METFTHSPTRKFAHLLMAVLAAFTLLLSVAPGADAQTRETKNPDTQVLAATQGCPDGFVEGRFGCQPENLTTKNGGGVEFDNGCPDKWVPSNAPGGCSPGFFTIELRGIDFDNGCPDKWVPSSAPGGCSPGYLTLKVAGLEFDNGCPDKWVPSSAPGGCSPGFITIDTGRQIFEAQHHCAFGSACDAMVEAVLALGGHCTSSTYGETCTMPTGPEGRD